MNPELPPAKPWAAPLLFLAVAFLAFFQGLVLPNYYFANDLMAFVYGDLGLLKHDLASGHLSLWNPYLFGGQPIFANPNYNRCNPFHYLIPLFSVPRGLSVYFFLHLFIGACGVYALLKALRLSESSARVGALIYGLSGDFWWELIHPSILTVLAFWPWLALSLEILSREWRPRPAFGAGLVSALIACAGNFQLTTSAIYGGLVFFAFRLYHWSSVEKTIPWGQRLSPRKLIPVLALGLWGLAPVALQLIPTLEFSQLSTRNQPDYDQLSGTFSMRPTSTYEFLFPFMGLAEGKSAEASIQDIDPPNTDNMSLGDFGYLGVWIPFLVYFAFKRKDRRFLYFLSGFALLSLLTAWGRYFPLHRIWCEILPGIALSRAPFRFLDIYVLFMVILAAFGYQTLERHFSDEKENAKPWLMGGLAYGALLMVVGLFQADRNWREMLGLALGMMGLFYWALAPGWKKMGQLFFQAGLILPLLLSGWADFGTGPASNFDFDRNAPIFSALKDNPPGSRFYMDMQIPYPVEENGQALYFPLPQDEAMDYRVRLMNGYDSINIRRTRELQNAQLPLPTQARLWDMKGLVFGQDRGEAKEFDHQQIGTAHYYGLKVPTSHLWAPHQVSVMPDDQCLAAMKSPGFDPAETAYLAPSPEASALALPSGKKAKLQYQWVTDEDDQQAFQVTLDQPSLVTFSEVYFPGWRAFLDQKPVPLYRANYDFRALLLPAGTHQVDFKYQPAWWGRGLLILALWLLSLPALWLIWKWKPVLA